MGGGGAGREVARDAGERPAPSPPSRGGLVTRRSSEAAPGRGGGGRRKGEEIKNDWGVRWELVRSGEGGDGG